MSRTHKEGKRRSRRIKTRPESQKIANAVNARHTFGRTEKIRRRNRKTWTRLGNKRRRALGRAETVKN